LFPAPVSALRDEERVEKDVPWTPKVPADENERSDDMAVTGQKIIPNLWFDRQAEEAANFYVSVFGNSSVGQITRATKAGFETHGLPEGTVLTAEFTVEGLAFVGINGGPLFKFNPSISFLVACRTKDEVDALWAKLSPGGAVLMELGPYPFSERYGWTTDRNGLSWQVMAAGERTIRQKITPTLMYVGAQAGKAETAMRFYASIFPNARVGDIDRYGPGEEPDRAGTVKHASFTLEGQQFAAMDSALAHEFAFNEAVSLMVRCEDQAEIDRYWTKLIDGGGQESMCGWLKDPFGVSWQVTPVALEEMLRDRDVRKVERVTDAFLKMRKFDLAELRRAFEGR
jgi:predicted 3-demethylubiquinone-9 3-methyltransferase (glyoxalase superfamily)